MLLEKLIKDLDKIEIVGNKDIDITEIVINSNSAVKDCLFVCLTGGNFDGHNYLTQAEKYGAKAVIVERKVDTHLTQIVVENARKALAIVSRAFYNYPDKDIKLIGVIGTNGKTTTSHLIYKILKNADKKVGLIGTLGTYYDEKYYEPSLTTPDPIELFKILDDMRKCSIDIVVMEVSAHAIYWDKVYGMKFEMAIFTNFSLDHLDFFNDLDNYKQTKLKFFKENNCKYVVTNSDDQVGREIISLKKKVITYGLDNPSDVFALDVNYSDRYSNFIINLFDCIYNVKLNLIGEFNVYNALASCTACALLGEKTESIIKGLETVKGVDGRLEKVLDNGVQVFIDYAHTPDGLEKALKTLKTVCKNRLICVFGCGGNRDVSKRKVMGEISGKLADFTVITSDNPRYEEPMDIICEIEKGVLTVTKKYVIVQDRKEGIKYALNYAKKDDIVLIAGKGSEKYQEIFGIKKMYNDKDTVMEIINGDIN